MSKDDVELKIWRPLYDEKMETAEVFKAVNFDCFEDPKANLECVGETYAEYFHDHRDGWECSWPMEFYIATMDDKFLGVVEVDRRSTPVFTARVLK